jgi:predicted sulfurtransferase
MTQPIVVAALYKFVTLEDYVDLREPCCRRWSTTASKAPC